MLVRSTAFFSSGDLLADRRYAWAMDLRDAGDLAAAADLLLQAVEKAPGFASAYFALGEVCERLGDVAGAVEAFRAALASDAADRLGAALHLARLGAVTAQGAMSPAYVRALFDQYAPGFDEALVKGLAYRGPAMLHAAVAAVCRAQSRPFHFARALDLGCGTGLAGRAFHPQIATLVGVDLSPAMVEKARASGFYDALRVADMLSFLTNADAGSAELVLAADAFVYVAELGPIFAEAARVLAPGGLFAFTLETHDGAGVILRDTLRYAHAKAYLRAALEAAGFAVLHLAPASTRTEKGRAVPGLMAAAAI